MNSEKDFRNQLLLSEFKLLMDKEREMRDLYNHILEKVESTHISDRVRAIRDDEERHMGYVEIILSLLGF
jgi:rubrerythrin